MCFQCIMGAASSGFRELKKGQQIEVKAHVGHPQLKKKTILTIYDIDGYSLVTTDGRAFMSRDMSHITPLAQIVDNPQLDDEQAKKRYERLIKGNS